MALTKVSTDGVKDDAITKTKIPANQIEASELADNAVDTNAIADQAVALSKLPHGTSSNDGKFLRANNGADPTFETVTGTTINNNADNRVITGSGTANTLNGESTFVYDTAENGVGIGISDPTPTASYYQGAFLHLHQAASGGNVGSQIHLTTDNTGSAAGDGSQISAYSSSLYINNQENGDTYFYNNGSSNLTIKANGSIGIGTQSPSDKLHVNGTALIGSNLYLSNNTYIASNKGIYFDGGTSSANYLDDYEEGTFTPTARGHSTNSSPVIEGSGKYTKIGNVVQIQLQFAAENGSYLPSGEYFQIHGLPFTFSGEHFIPYGFNYKVVFDSSYQYLFYSPNGGTRLEGYINRSDLPYTPWGTNDWDNTQWYHSNSFSYITS